MARRIGWYRLRSGMAFHGTIPEGAQELSGPFVAQVMPTRPTKSATKAAWVGWAVHVGWAAEDAERKTKRQLVDELGSVELPQQLVDPAESSEAVGSDDAGVDLAAESGELGTGPGDGPPAEQDTDGDDGIVGHAEDGTSG